MAIIDPSSLMVTVPLSGSSPLAFTWILPTDAFLLLKVIGVPILYVESFTWSWV